MLPLAGGPLLRVATIRSTTDTFLFISHTTNVVFIGVRIIKEMPGSVASGTHCITNKMQRYTIFFITVNALHVSGGFSAHLQELKNCTHSIGYMSSLPAATADEGVSCNIDVTDLIISN